MSDRFAVAPIDHELVARTDVATSRPALTRAGYRCERCGRDAGLRVVRGYGQLVVLCARCRLRGGFTIVLGWRKQSVADAKGG
jgi:hypothetical protein